MSFLIYILIDIVYKRIRIRNLVSCRLKIEVKKETRLTCRFYLILNLFKDNRLSASSYSGNDLDQITIVKWSDLL